MTMLSAGFEPAIPGLRREQSCVIDGKATGIVTKYYYGEHIQNGEMGRECGTHERGMDS
jgi:hypothetical protein